MIMISGANEEELELASARMDIMLATNYTPDNPGPLAIIDKYHDKEIERLKKKLDCDLQWAKKYDELFEENNRLNNIIDELEKTLEYEKNDYGANIDIETHNIDSEFLRGNSWEADYILDKLKELKEGK